MTLPSVNRALKKFRHALAPQKKVLEYLECKAGELGFPQFMLYVWFIENAAFLQRAKGEENSGNLKECLTRCPHTKPPQNFTFDHVDIEFDDQTFPHPANPQLKPGFPLTELREVLARKGYCRHCPFGAGAARNLAVGFADCPGLYLDLNYYLSCFRVRTVSEFYFHYVAALIISLTRRIALRREEKALARGIPIPDAVKLATRKQARMVNVIYDLLLEPPPESVDEFGCFIHIGGSGSSSNS